MFTYLFSIALILFLSLPALLVILFFQRRVPPASQPDFQQKWLKTLLQATTFFSLLFAAIVFISGRNSSGPAVLAPLPVLEGLLALLLIHWRLVLSSWGVNKKLVILTLASYLLALLATLLTDTPSFALVLIIPPFFIALLWNLARRLNLTWTALLALVLIVFLWLDAVGIAASHTVFANPGLRTVYQISSGLAAMLAVLLAAFFVYRLVTPRPGEAQRPLLYLSLAIVLVLSVGAVTFRHGMLAQATGRAFEDHLPLFTLALSLILGLVLALSLEGRGRWAGLAFLLLATFSVLFFYFLGWQVDSEAITAARAQDIEQAIQGYRQETGAYPATIAELSPGYLTILLGPLTGRGQAWCYQSGADFYRLGYVYFQRYHQYPDDTPFWEPFYDIVVPSAAGQPPPGEWICDEELRLFKQHNGL
jgi:hypothetical protein